MTLFERFQRRRQQQQQHHRSSMNNHHNNAVTLTTATPPITKRIRIKNKLTTTPMYYYYHQQYSQNKNQQQQQSFGEEQRFLTTTNTTIINQSSIKNESIGSSSQPQHHVIGKNTSKNNILNDSKNECLQLCDENTKNEDDEKKKSTGAMIGTASVLTTTNSSCTDHNVVACINHDDNRNNNGMHFNNHNEFHDNTNHHSSIIVVPSSKQQSPPFHLFHTTNVRSSNSSSIIRRLPIPEMTARIIQLEVEALLLSYYGITKMKNNMTTPSTLPAVVVNSSSSLDVVLTGLRLANALVASTNIIDVYSNYDNNKSENKDDDDLDGGNMDGGLRTLRFFHNNQYQQQRRRRKWLLKNRSRYNTSSSSQLLSSWMNHTGSKKRQKLIEIHQLKRKYEWMNAMNTLQTLPNSQHCIITSWEDAYHFLSNVLSLPPDLLETTDVTENEDFIAQTQTETESLNNFSTINRIGTSSSKTTTPRFNISNNGTTTTLSPTVATSTSHGGIDSYIQRLNQMKLDDMSQRIFGGLSPAQHLHQQIVTSVPMNDQNEIQKEKELFDTTLQLYEKEKMEYNKKKKEDNETTSDDELVLKTIMEPLTKEEVNLITTTMSTGHAQDIISQIQTDTISRASFRTLQNGQWLNDEVINYFLLQLQNRDEILCTNDNPKQQKRSRRCHFFKTFFVTKLRNEGHPKLHGTYEYKNVKRWSKNVPGKDLFELHKIFFPINMGSMHWVCCVVNIQTQCIQFYDSLGGDGSVYVHDIFQYLQDEHVTKKGCTLPNIEQWKLISQTTIDTPRQLNGYDCGVFTCMFIDFLSMDRPLLFTQEHVTQCRQRIALSILQGKAVGV